MNDLPHPIDRTLSQRPCSKCWQHLATDTSQDKKILCKFLPWVAFWLRYKTLAYLGLQRIEGSMEQWQPQERCHEQLETQRATARIGKTLLPNVLLWVVSLGPSKK